MSASDGTSSALQSAAGVKGESWREIAATIAQHAYRSTGRISSQEFARESLRRAILSGAIPPGATLTQAGIAEALGVSTTPVREALRDLASDGLIDIGRYTTTSVHEPTVQELEEIYDLRKLLETHAVRRIIERGDRSVLDRAEALQRRMDDEEDPAEWLLLNAEFHLTLTEGAGSRRLSAILETLRGGVAVFVGMAIRQNPTRRVESNEEHWAILQACRRGDAETAIRLSEVHMDPTRDLVESALG
jgi:DNA-binding GntR family transcriptional regulator